VLKFSQGLAFEQELADCGRRAEMTSDHFNGNGLSEAFGNALAKVDDTHTAATEDALDAKGAKHASEPRVCRRGVRADLGRFLPEEKLLPFDRRRGGDEFFYGGVRLN
jgi:hypothetical protein